MHHFYAKLRLLQATILLGAVLAPSVVSADNPDPAAEAILGSAMDAMGGEQLLASLKSLKFDIRETQFRVDDSERNASPWWESHLDITETRDLKLERYRLEAAVENPQFVYTQTTISDGDIIATGRARNGKTGWGGKPETHERLQLSPENILFAAVEAGDVRKLPDASIHDVIHHDLQFTWRGFKVDIFVNADTHLPDRISSLRSDPYDIAPNAWGDILWTTDFLFWKRETDGLVYPRQWDTARNGIPVLTDSVISLAENVPLEKVSFDIPDDAKKQFADSGHLPVDDYPFDGPKQLTAVGKDVWLITGNWNVLVVRQADGLVVIDCPQSGAYSAKVLDFLRQRFSGAKVKALVSTTDSTWHYAGLRTYMARGIPAYALDHNMPLLHDFLAAPHSLIPDEYSRGIHTPDLRAVSERTVIGAGDNRIELYPIRGEDDERMLMAYLPGQRLLYGSSNDVFDSGQGVKAGTFNLPELVNAVQARHLVVTSYVAIHTAMTPWQDVVHIALESPALH